MLNEKMSFSSAVRCEDELICLTQGEIGTYEMTIGTPVGMISKKSDVDCNMMVRRY